MLFFLKKNYFFFKKDLTNGTFCAAFEYVFNMFTRDASENMTYNGYRLLANDGSDIHFPTDKNDVDSYYPGTNGQKPYNLLHLNAMYDLCEHIYVDAVIQKTRMANEHKAFTTMVLDSQKF